MPPAAKNRRPFLIRLLWLAGAALVGLGLAYHFLTPKTYQSVAKVRLIMQGLRESTERPAALALEAPLLQSDLAFLRSDDLLARAATNLPHLPAPDLAFLKRRVRIDPIPRTTAYAITVSGPDPLLTAQIANALAAAYLDYRVQQRQTITSAKVDAVESRWAAQNEKIRAAHERLAQAVADIERARATTTNTLYDAASIARMQTRRVDLEAECTRQESLLATLDRQTPEQLKQSLPLLVTNSLLNSLLLRLAAAERDLASQRALNGESALETRHAAIAAHELNQDALDLIRDVLSAEHDHLAARQLVLRGLEAELARASTNTIALSTNNPAYLSALQDVRRLERERDSMKAALDPVALAAAVPFFPSAEIVDNAEAPARPATPDFHLTLALIGTGALSCLLGLFGEIIVRSARARRAPAETPAT